MQFLSSALILASTMMLLQIQATPSGLSAINSFDQESHVLKRAENPPGPDSNVTDATPSNETSTPEKLGSTGGNTTDLPQKNASTTNPDSLNPSANTTAVNSTDSSPVSAPSKGKSNEDQIKAAKEAITKQRKVTKAEWRKFQDEEEKLQKLIHDLVVLEMKSRKPPSTMSLI
ncbi:secreted protein [Melampsora americana]|nr:secreted protein [Melampsora americana]